MYGAEIVYSPGDQGLQRRGRAGARDGRGRRLVLHALPVRQPGQPGRPLQRHRARDPRGARRGRRVRRRPRHRRHADGQRPAAARRTTRDDVKIVAAEPMQGELVQGLRSLDDGFIPPIIDLSLLDRKIFVSNRDAIVWTQKLLDEEGIFAGVSSGAIASIAVRIAERARRGQRRLHRPRRRLEVPLLGRLHDAGRGAREAGLHRLVVRRRRRGLLGAGVLAVARGSRAAARAASRCGARPPADAVRARILRAELAAGAPVVGSPLAEVTARQDVRHAARRGAGARRASGTADLATALARKQEAVFDVRRSPSAAARRPRTGSR